MVPRNNLLVCVTRKVYYCAKVSFFFCFTSFLFLFSGGDLACVVFSQPSSLWHYFACFCLPYEFVVLFFSFCSLSCSIACAHRKFVPGISLTIGPESGRTLWVYYIIHNEAGQDGRLNVKTPHTLGRLTLCTRGILHHEKRFSLHCGCVCSFFLPVDIQRNQCPCRFFNLGEIQSSVLTKLRHRDTSNTNMQAVR